MVYTVTKRLEVSAAHHLQLDYESKCQHLHGHNWIIHVTCQAETLNANGMVIDFKQIKEIVQTKMDHQKYFRLIRRRKILPNGFATMCRTASRCRCRKVKGM